MVLKTTAQPLSGTPLVDLLLRDLTDRVATLTFQVPLPLADGYSPKSEPNVYTGWVPYPVIILYNNSEYL